MLSLMLINFNRKKCTQRLQGIPKAKVSQIVQEKMHQLSLVEFENKRAESLSGGNKRKLSVAIALIGNPPLLFMDEPSTGKGWRKARGSQSWYKVSLSRYAGMDPVTRRVMWDVIADIATHRRESSIILTTHSMEECEALATRVAIMVGGRLRCLGSIQHIKNTHAQGYQLRLKLGAPHDIALTDISNAISRHLSGESCAASSASSIRIPEAHLSNICLALGDSSMGQEINSEGSGWMIFASMKSSDDRSTSLHEFAHWWAEEQQCKAALSFVSEHFLGSELIEQQGTLLNFKIPSQNMALSTMFSKIEDAKPTLGIREYALSQTSLEQVFNFFASQQEEERGVAHGIRTNR